MSKSEDRTNRTARPTPRWARAVALALAVSVALLVLPGAASASDAPSVFSSPGLGDTTLASTATASATGATITSDKADYGPGGWVYLTGAGWAPGESVRIVVNDDGGAYEEPWQRDVTVTADDAGNIADEFELPPWFVATYMVTATGEQSGTATTSFTDEVTSTASVDRTDAYRNRTGVSFTFTVNVTAGDPAGSLRITAPNNAYTFTGCSTTRASWTPTLVSSGQCVFQSSNNATPVNAIPVGGSGTFTVTASISAGDNNLNPSGNGSWNTIRVAPGGLYVNNQANAATTAATNSLAANAYAFEVTDAFVAASTSTIGSPCPSPPTPKTATVSTTRVIVVCGRPGTTQANLTPLAANSSLGGTMIGTAGTFKSASILGSTAAPIVLANYGAPSPDSFTTITSAAGAGKTVEAKIGSSSSRTSPITTLTDFEALAACTAASVATQPASQSITYGDNATFTATGNGDPAPTVQWQRSTDGGTTWDNLPDETSTTLTVTKPGVSQSGNRYRAVFSNTCNGTQTATSDAATLTVNPRQVTVTADAKSKTYGEADPPLTYQITSGSLVAGDSFSGALTRDPGQDAGTYAIKQGTLALSGNYELSFIGANLTIGAATLFVDADPQAKTYGEDDPQLTYSLRGFQFTDDAESAGVTGAADCSRAPGEDVGEYAITCAPGTLAIDPEAPQNYVFEAGDSADLTIGAATVFVDVDDQSKTYGEDDPELTYSLRGFQFTDDAESAGVTGAAVCERAPGEDVVEGGYEITCAPGTLAIDAAEPQNYEFAVGNAGTLTITPATLFVDADPQSTTYGDDDPALTATLRGFQFTDDAESAGVTGAAACEREPGEDVGEYTITCTPGTLAIDSAEPQNYVFEVGNSAALTIERKALTGSFTAANKTYDGDASATVTSRSLSGVVGSDDVTLAGGTATFADKNFGEDKTVTLAGATLAGDEAGNYTLDSVDTTTADITARDLTVTATGVDREYDGGTSATVELSTDKVGDDDVTPHYTSASFADKNVGIDKTVSVSGITMSGDDVDAGNYNLLNTTEETEADITARPLTGSFTAANKVYDGNTSATVLSRTLAVVVPLDDVNLTGGTAAFNNKFVGNGKPVTLTGATLAGADKDNYTLAGVNTATANITAWSAQGHGFYEPVGVLNSIFVAAPDPAPAAPGTTVWHTAKGGSTIPLKFNVYAGTVERTSTSDISAFTQLRIPCATGIPGDEVDLVTTGGTSLRYDTTGHQFIQNWKTPTASTETCYRATVTFADGSSLSAFFKLRK